jgi:hypothetical protein
MKRSSFLKSLLGIAIAPKVLVDVASKKPDFIPVVWPETPIKDMSWVTLKGRRVGSSYLHKSYISAIQFLDQREISSSTLKYGDESFWDIQDTVGKYKKQKA